MNNQKYSQNKYLIAARFLIGFYIAYNVYLIPIGFFIPRLSIVTLILAGALTLSSVNIKLNSEFRCLMFFIIYAFTTGLLVAVDHGLIIGKTRFLIESLIVGLIVLNVSKDEKDLKQIIDIFAVGAIFVGVYSFFNADYLYYQRGRLSLEEDFNANTFGVMLMYGVWSIIFTLHNEKTSFVRIIIIVFLCLLLLYTIVQTGSRKSSIGSLLILLSYAVYVLVGQGKTRKKYSKVIVVPLFVAFIAFVYFRYIDAFLERSETLINRMEDIDTAGVGRWGLVKESFRVWSEHPIFGVGLDNNRYYTFTRQYAHNSYAEIFACTGLIGAVLFLPIFYRMLVFLINGVSRIKSLLKFPAKYYMIVLILVYLFVCFTQINIYNQTHMIVTYFILTFIAINSKSNEKDSQIIV